MKFLLVTLLALLAMGALTKHKHTCIHDKISSNFKPEREETLSDAERQHRLLQYTKTRPIKIVIDDSNMVGVTAEERDMIVGKLVPVSTQFLSRRLQVLTKGSNLKVGRSTCYEAEVPSAHQTVGLDADLIIYVTAKNEPNEGFIAWATSCLQDSVTGRPIAGQINFNLNFLSLNPADFEPQVDTTLHEITHILAFSGQLYPSFTKSFFSHELMGDTNVWTRNYVSRGTTRQAIKTPKVLETARKYFNCPTLKGVEIENEGGSGSAGAHWERTILHNEQMTASDIPDASYSEFTLSILHDSGWYQVDFTKAEPMFYGKNAGCDFLDKACSSTTPRKEFCSNQNQMCSFSYKAKAYCGQDNFADGCKYAQAYSNGKCEDPASTSSQDVRGEVYAPGSRCVFGSVLESGYDNRGTDSTLCFKYQCTSDGKIKFLPKLGGEIICSKEGERGAASGKYTGSIKCPDPKDFCQDFYPGCPNSCSSKGYCVVGKCECRAGYSGADCSIVGDGGSTPTPTPTPNPTPNPTPVDPCASVSCGANGYCLNGVCNCFTGYSGPNCLPNPVDPCQGVYCGSNGKCSAGKCVCNTGYTGTYCDKTVTPTPTPTPTPTTNTGCPSNCNGRGTCLGSFCKCLKGYSGSSCETAAPGYSGSCSNDCGGFSGRGGCLTTEIRSSTGTSYQYSCQCEPGWTGADCMTLQSPTTRCPNDCGKSSKYGTCNSSTGKCLCSDYYKGADCSQPSCPGWCDGGSCSLSKTTVNGVTTSKFSCNCSKAPYDSLCYKVTF